MVRRLPPYPKWGNEGEPRFPIPRGQREACGKTCILACADTWPEVGKRCANRVWRSAKHEATPRLGWPRDGLGRGSGDVSRSLDAGPSQLRLRRRLGLHRPDRTRRGRTGRRSAHRLPGAAARHLRSAGVRIAKWLGDGVMLVCVETRPLLATILELHHVVCEVSGPVQTVSIRSGITSGDVILMEGDDYVGHCVNVAARLCDLAQGGEALAVPSVMKELPRWGVVLADKNISLRGVEKPVLASTIGMATSSSDRLFDPICGLPMTEATAEETASDDRGNVALFCSAGCLDTWRRRPTSSPAARGGSNAAG